MKTDPSPVADRGAELNIADLVERVAERVPERAAIVSSARSLTYAEFVDRGRRLATFLRSRGFGCHTERAQLAGHEVGQDLLGQVLYNGHEYLEGIVGACRARLGPLNVNYRYVANEMLALLTDASPAVLQYHAAFAPVLAEVVPHVPSIKLLLQVADDSGNDLLPGALDYEQVLADTLPDIDTEVSPDDVYIIYTGGTTGAPRGVLWRQGDAIPQAIGVRNRRERREWAGTDERLAALPTNPQRILPAAPFMHGAAQWAALQALMDGHTVAIQATVNRLDPADIWRTVDTFDVNVLTIVGDAFARPLLDELDRGGYDTSSLHTVVTGGSALQVVQKERFSKLVEGVVIVDTMGSSESGVQAQSRSGGGEHRRAVFAPDPSSVVISEDMTHRLQPGHDGIGWLATTGRLPLGYLNDAAKTARTFPVVDGQRVGVPGDRARWLADGTVEVLGRESVTINSGGEKIFAEEVEAAVKLHPEVADAVVCGRPSEQWGAEVVAIVQQRPGTTPLTLAAINAVCAEQITRYKHPKELVLVESVVRSPSGKADYRWAADVAVDPQRHIGALS